MFLSLLLISCGTAKEVSYYHKFFSTEGCYISYSALQQEGQLQIIVTVKSSTLVFGANPTMMLKNFNGDVLKLGGVSLQSRTETSGVIVNNVVVPVSQVGSLAQFPIPQEDIEFFKPGISKIRLYTIPTIHEKTFSKDVIGSYLYQELTRASATEDVF